MVGILIFGVNSIVGGCVKWLIVIVDSLGQSRSEVTRPFDAVFGSDIGARANS